MRITNTTGRPMRVGRLTLAKGTNEVDADAWKAIADHPHVVADLAAAKAGGPGLVVEEAPAPARRGQGRGAEQPQPEPTPTSEPPAE